MLPKQNTNNRVGLETHENRNIESKTLKKAISFLKDRLQNHPISDLKFMYDDPAAKSGGGTCLRKNGTELIYFSKSKCVIIDTQNGKRKSEKTFPPKMIFDTSPRFKISGTFLSKSEELLIILLQESHLHKLPNFWLYDIKKNRTILFKFKDPSVKLIHNHGFKNKVYFTKYNGYSLKDTLFDPYSPNFKPKERVVYKGLCLFELDLTTRKIKFIKNLSNEKKNLIAYQCVLDNEIHKKSIVWYIEQKKNSKNLLIKSINIKEKRTLFSLNVKGFIKGIIEDFQPGCDIMNYVTFCSCIDKKFHIYDLDIFENDHVYLEKLTRKAFIINVKDSEDSSEFYYIAGVYNGDKESEVSMRVEAQEYSQKNLRLMKLEKIILLIGKYPSNHQLTLKMIRKIPKEFDIFKFNPVILKHNISLSGNLYALSLINTFTGKELVRCYSNDMLGNYTGYHNGIIKFHFFIKDASFFLSIGMDYKDGAPWTWSEAFSNCSQELMNDIEDFAGQDNDAQMRVSGDVCYSQPDRKYCLFLLNGVFVLFEIGTKKLKWRSKFNKYLKERKKVIYELREDKNNFYVGVNTLDSMKERTIVRRLYEYSMIDEKSKILEEKLILKFDNYLPQDMEIHDLKFYFFSEGDYYIVYYIAKESEKDSPLVFKYNTKTEELNAVSFNKKFFLTAMNQNYGKGGNYTIYPKNEFKLFELNKSGSLRIPKVIYLKGKKILEYRIPENLPHSNFVYTDEEILYEIKWAGYQDNNFYLWTVFSNQELMVYSKNSIDVEKGEILRKINTGNLTFNFNLSQFHFDEYAFKPSSSAAIFCYLREKYIERNYKSHFKYLNKIIDNVEILDEVQEISRDHGVYREFVRKLQRVYFLFNVDPSYVKEKIELLKIIEMIEDDEVIKRYVFYEFATKTNQKRIELNQSIEKFVHRFKELERVKILVREVLNNGRNNF